MIDPAQELAGVMCDAGQFFDQSPLDRGNQCSAHSMAHDIANENTGFCVRERQDVKKIPAYCASWQIFRLKLQRAKKIAKCGSIDDAERNIDITNRHSAGTCKDKREEWNQERD